MFLRRIEFESAQARNDLSFDTCFLAKFAQSSNFRRFARLDMTLWQDTLLRSFQSANHCELRGTVTLPNYNCSCMGPTFHVHFATA